MPGGKIHNALTLATLSGVLAPYLIIQFGANPYLYAGGILLGTLISPDLDIDSGNISDTMIRKVSRPAQIVWRVAWQPYGWIVPHRHPISHFPFLGTVLRIGYIFGIINVILLILNLFFDSVSFIWIWNWSFFFGLAHADLVHWAVDNTVKGKESMINE